MGRLTPKILYLVTEDWYFCSHRIRLARAARDAGYEVVVMTRVNHHGAEIREQGFTLIPVDFPRSARHPGRDLKTLGAVVERYRVERPDIVHHVSLKPVLYGSVAAARVGVPVVVNALTGLGYLFTGSRWSAKLLRAVVAPMLGAVLRRENSWAIVQNPDDRRTLCDAGLLRAAALTIIRGSGVDIERFRPSREPEGTPIVVLAGRMLWDKGVGEFVQAAERLRQERVDARFVLVGGTDPENPMSIPVRELERWHRSGCIEWWGRREDMPKIFACAHVACLPSYREGLPTVLIEAAASGRPIVTTDAPGCREIVRHGENGLLVPVRDVGRLADALKRLINDAGLRERMGARGREIAASEFSIARVVGETLALYGQLLERAGRPV